MASNTISEPNEAIKETKAIKEVIEVGGVEEDKGLNSEAEELLVV